MFAEIDENKNMGELGPAKKIRQIRAFDGVFIKSLQELPAEKEQMRHDVTTKDRNM